MTVDHSTAKELLEAAHKAVSEASIPKPLEEVAFGKAFDFLAGRPGPAARAAAPGGGSAQTQTETEATEGLDLSGAEEFFGSRESGKPHENARLAAAYLYNVYGSSPFTFDDIRAIGEHVGLTLSDRLDMTLGRAKTGGKRMFRSAGRGKFAPTVHGEQHMRTQYSVTKGTRKRG